MTPSLPYQRRRVLDERSRLDPVGTFALCALLFSCGHIVAEVTAAYLLEVRFQVVVPRPTNPHQFDKLIEQVIGDTIIEVVMATAEAVVVFATQMACLVVSGAVLRRKAFLYALSFGAASDLLRWGYPHPIPEARQWAIAVSLAVMAGCVLFLRGVLGSRDAMAAK
jgi:hypothetical protein